MAKSPFFVFDHTGFLSGIPKPNGDSVRVFIFWIYDAPGKIYPLSGAADSDIIIAVLFAKTYKAGIVKIDAPREM